MKLVTYQMATEPGAPPRLGVLLAAAGDPGAGTVLDVPAAFDRVALEYQPGPTPATMQALLDAGPAMMDALRTVLHALDVDGTQAPPAAQQARLGAAARPLGDVRLLAPLPRPNTLRDFYAFEQHVKAARALRGLDMLPEWYEIPVFYFSNPEAVIGPDAPLEMPQIQDLDYELELACVIGRAGRD